MSDEKKPVKVIRLMALGQLYGNVKTARIALDNESILISSGVSEDIGRKIFSIKKLIHEIEGSILNEKLEAIDNEQ